jgi:uncharacterized protein
MAHQNRETIEKAYAAFTDGDIATIMTFWTDDVAWHVAGEHPLAGDHEGKEAVANFLGGVMERTGGTFRAELQNALADDTNGYSLHKGTATRDGEPLESWEVLGYQFRDGRIAEIWSFPFDLRISERVLS